MRLASFLTLCLCAGVANALSGWTKTKNVRCGTGKWYVDQAKDKSKNYQQNVEICAKKCNGNKAKCFAFDIHHDKGGSYKGGYCNLFTKDQCSKFSGNGAYDAYKRAAGGGKKPAPAPAKFIGGWHKT